MRVLVTGMTSRQASARSAERAVNFTGLLVAALRSGGDDVHWVEPDVTWTPADLDSYDKVVVGVSPLLSLASNRAYGALNVIGHRWGGDEGSLVLFMDAPDAKKVGVNMRVLLSQPDSLTKRFFSYRKGYAQACVPAVRDHLVETVGIMSLGAWPTTFVPALPWQSSTSRVFEAAHALVGGDGATPIMLDAFIAPPTVPLSAKRRHWAVDSMKPDWYRTVGATWPVEALTGKSWVNDERIMKTLASTSGTLIEPTRLGTFWTPRFKQSLMCNTPVYSNWLETMTLGESWSMLPSSIEDLDEDALVTLASMQLESYVNDVTPDSAVYDELTR